MLSLHTGATYSLDSGDLSITDEGSVSFIDSYGLHDRGKKYHLSMSALFVLSSRRSSHFLSPLDVLVVLWRQSFPCSFVLSGARRIEAQRKNNASDLIQEMIGE